MLSARRRVILRQIVRPPYVYRWAGLLGVVAMVVGTTAVVLSGVEVGSVLATARGTAVAAPGRVVAPQPAALSPAPAALPAAVPSLLSTTGGSARAVALTFDDGPDPAYTPEILDLLAGYGASATFCMVGEQAVAHPALVHRVVAEGHRLCNHTFTHDAGVAHRSPDVMDAQLRRSRDALAGVAGPGVPIPYFRAPEGVWSLPLQRTAAQEGMRPLGWSVDPLDWTTPGTATIVDVVERRTSPGAVVLLHDGGGPREQTVAALRELLPALRDRGYAFVLPS